MVSAIVVLASWRSIDRVEPEFRSICGVWVSLIATYNRWSIADAQPTFAPRWWPEVLCRRPIITFQATPNRILSFSKRKKVSVRKQFYNNGYYSKKGELIFHFSHRLKGCLAKKAIWTKENVRIRLTFTGEIKWLVLLRHGKCFNCR